MTITVEELKSWVNDNCILDSNSEWIGTIDTPSLYAKLDELDTTVKILEVKSDILQDDNGDYAKLSIDIGDLLNRLKELGVLPETKAERKLAEHKVWLENKKQEALRFGYEGIYVIYGHCLDNLNKKEGE